MDLILSHSPQNEKCGDLQINSSNADQDASLQEHRSMVVELGS